MDCSAIDCTPEDVLEEMGLSRKGDICFESLAFSKNRAQDSLERENKKRKLVEEMIKGNKISKRESLHL